MMKASYEDCVWQGIQVRAGELITGRSQLAKETNLSEREIRTCLGRLSQSNEIAIKSTNKFSIITLTNWDSYQIDETKRPAKRPAERPANDQPIDRRNDQQNDQQYAAVNRAQWEMSDQQNDPQNDPVNASKTTSKTTGQTTTYKKLRNQERTPPIAPPKAFSTTTIEILRNCGFDENEIKQIQLTSDEKGVCESIAELKKKDMSVINSPFAYLKKLIATNAGAKEKKLNDYLSQQEESTDTRIPGMALQTHQESFFKRFMGLIRDNVGEATFNSWFYEINLVDKTGDEIILECKSRFIKEQIIANHEDLLRKMQLAWRVSNIRLVYKEKDIAKSA
jgi:hypothetical protein